MIIIDISPLISEKTAVFPGDQSFERKVHMDCDKGDHLGLSSVTTTLHIGAHCDAVNHYGANSPGIEQKDLRIYFGACQVFDVTGLPAGARIKVEDIDMSAVKRPRILFKTNSFPDPNSWNSDFNSLSPELIDELAGRGVVLVGIDTPSVDPQDSKKLESHQALLRNDVSVLEGLVLSSVSEGEYSLISLPLPIKDGDASPVRAILLPQGDLKEPLNPARD